MPNRSWHRPHGGDGDLKPGWRIALCVAGLVLVVTLFTWLYPRLVPKAVPTYKQPNPLVLIFDKRMVIGLSRTGLVVLGSAVVVYLLFSIVAHIWRGRWLVAWGTARTAREVDKLKQNRTVLAAEASAAKERAQDLEGKFQQVSEAVATVLAEVPPGTLLAGGAGSDGTDEATTGDGTTAGPGGSGGSEGRAPSSPGSP